MLGSAEENVPKMIRLGDLLHLGARIGDGDKAAARFVGAHCLLYAIEEILLEDIGLERAARLAGNNEQSFCQIDFLFERFDLCGVGRVEHKQLGETGNVCRRSLLRTSGQRLDPPMPSREHAGKSAIFGIVRGTPESVECAPAGRRQCPASRATCLRQSWSRATRRAPTSGGLCLSLCQSAMAVLTAVVKVRRQFVGLVDFEFTWRVFSTAVQQLVEARRRV